MNPFSEADRLDMILLCAFEAVQSNFRHLSIDQIAQPPRTHKDAQLARQIAIRIANVDFKLPRKRISILMKRNRASTMMAIRGVDIRLEDEMFSAAYQRMAGKAFALYEDHMSRAA